MSKRILLILTLAAFAASCGQGSTPNLNDYIDDEEVSQYEEEVIDNETMPSDIVRVPFREECGVKLVSATINGSINADMIFDSGCSESTISINEAQYLVSVGKLTEDDYLGTAQAQIADGTVVEDMVFIIRSLTLSSKDGTIEFKNVTVTVSANQNAPLLLGNGVLNRTAKYTVDNENKEIVFHVF